MSIQELERNLEQGLDIFYDKYKDTFERIQHHEIALREGAVETPAAINDAMKELVSLYSTLNTATALIESKTKVKEAQSYISNNDRLNGTKPSEKYINSFVVQDVNLYMRACKIFSNYRDSCDRMTSVLQSSLNYAKKERVID